MDQLSIVHVCSGVRSLDRKQHTFTKTPSVAAVDTEQDSEQDSRGQVLKATDV